MTAAGFFGWAISTWGALLLLFQAHHLLLISLPGGFFLKVKLPLAV